MTTNITLNKTFEIDLDDQTTISVTVSLDASTEDDIDDAEAGDRIRRFTYDNVIEPLQDTLTELFIAEDLADILATDE
jgi:molybdenum cofactor biosynthesis enzyme MoaA